MVKFLESKTEYLLFIHPSQKERSKAINGRKWYIDRKCWVYPRTPRNYDAIIAEFGDDLTENQATRPDSIASPPTITKEIEEIKQSIQKIVTSQTEPELKTLTDTIATLNQELATKNDQIQLLEQQLHQSQNWQTVIKEIALEAADRDAIMAELLDASGIDESLPIRITSKLEQKLRLILRASEENTSFSDLIGMAKEAELLDRDVINLLHIIRKQRNILTHQSVHPKTKLARVILCLFATTMVLPELPE